MSRTLLALLLISVPILSASMRPVSATEVEGVYREIDGSSFYKQHAYRCIHPVENTPGAVIINLPRSLRVGQGRQGRAQESEPLSDDSDRASGAPPSLVRASGVRGNGNVQAVFDPALDGRLQGALGFRERLFERFALGDRLRNVS